MSYEKYYPNGWQSGENGGTPITPEALNHMEDGLKGHINNEANPHKVTPAQIGASPADTQQIYFVFDGSNGFIEIKLLSETGPHGAQLT